jgi:hypothetical protein
MIIPNRNIVINQSYNNKDKRLLKPIIKSINNSSTMLSFRLTKIETAATAHYSTFVPVRNVQPQSERLSLTASFESKKSFLVLLL